MKNSIKLKPEINELYTLNEFIESVIQKNDMQVELILEEIFSNIINYSTAEFINVNASFENHSLTIEFVDNGIEFNPLTTEEHEIPENIDDAKIGGLGIFLTKELSDEMEYQYQDGENHLKIIKKVE